MTKSLNKTQWSRRTREILSWHLFVFSFCYNFKFSLKASRKGRWIREAKRCSVVFFPTLQKVNQNRYIQQTRHRKVKLSVRRSMQHNSILKQIHSNLLIVDDRLLRSTECLIAYNHPWRGWGVFEVLWDQLRRLTMINRATCYDRFKWWEWREIELFKRTVIDYVAK